ncbi:MAG: hypothetical protein AB1634_04895 [Thermodesulfobacteriota bacterium]
MRTENSFDNMSVGPAPATFHRPVAGAGLAGELGRLPPDEALIQDR